MKHGRVLLPLMLLASACVDVTINNRSTADDASQSIVGCGLGGTSGGSPVNGAEPGSDASTFQPPNATDSITLRGNLDQTAISVDWNEATPTTTSNFTTSLIVYDSVGKAIQLDIYFGKDDAGALRPGDSGAWTYHVMTDGMNLAFQSDGATRGSPGRPTQIAIGALRFDTSGRLVSNSTTNQGFYPQGAMSPQVLTFNFGTGTEVGGSGLDGITQYAATSAISFISQSGSAFVP